MGACSQSDEFYDWTIARQRIMSMKRSGMRIAPLMLMVSGHGFIDCSVNEGGSAFAHAFSVFLNDGSLLRGHACKIAKCKTGV